MRTFTHTRLVAIGAPATLHLACDLPGRACGHFPIFSRHCQQEAHRVLCLAFSNCFIGWSRIRNLRPFLDWLLPHNPTKLFFLGMPLLPVAAAQLFLTFVLFGVLAILVTRKSLRTTGTATITSVAIGTLVLCQILLSANLTMAGPQTWTYPVPFRGFNYLNVQPSILRPPNEGKLTAFDRLFEMEKYRVIVLSDNIQYSGTNIPHLAHFWKARSIGGYGTGVAERLTKLPWPEGVQTLRTIDFVSTNDLDKSAVALLAFLNVKYLISLSQTFTLISPTAPTVARTGPFDRL